jgi:hypothetical protein
MQKIAKKKPRERIAQKLNIFALVYLDAIVDKYCFAELK